MARLFGLPADVRKPRLASLIRAVDLLGVSGDPIAGFSNGMTARLAVATSLINEPDLLIWDEPTHGLDPEARRSMLELIKTLASEKTLIVSSHNLSDIDEVCNHAAVLSRGQLIYCGSLQDLKGRMRRNHYELDLEGDQKAITKAAQAIKGLQDFKAVQLRQRRLELRMTDDAVNTSALANVFMTLADNKVTLVSIRSVGQQTEQAFLDLVEKEESRGFARAYQRRRRCLNTRFAPAVCRSMSSQTKGEAVDSPVPTNRYKVNRWLPYLAVFQADVRQTLQSWVYRAWVLVAILSALGFLLYRVGVYREAGMVQHASILISDLLRWSVFGSVTLIIVLTAGSISAERGTLADSVLSRGISRHQYFLGKWHARLATVLGTFLIVGLVAMVCSFFLLHEDLDWRGSLVALVTVAAFLGVVISGGVSASAIFNSPLLAIAVLWITLYGDRFRPFIASRTLSFSLSSNQYAACHRARRIQHGGSRPIDRLVRVAFLGIGPYRPRLLLPARRVMLRWTRSSISLAQAAHRSGTCKRLNGLFCGRYNLSLPVDICP